jgi:phospholipid/cholesterol/gamma-HCH transport system substrate-binding protein
LGNKLTYTLVGLFVVVFGAALAIGVVWLSSSSDNVEYTTYQAYMRESVSGLNPRAMVTYRGVEVGHVSHIALDKNNPERVELLLNIEEDTPIKEDTLAVLATQGITGIAHVELTGGSTQSPPLKARPGQAYPIIETRPSLLVRMDTAVSALLARLTQMAAQIGNVADRVNQVLDDKNQKQLASTLANVEQITGMLAQRTTNMEQSITALSHIMTAGVTTANQLPELAQQTRASLQDLQQTIRTINDTTQRLGQFVNDSNGHMSQFTHDALPQVSPLLAEMRRLAASVDRVTRDLQQHPDALLFGRPVARPGPGE